jgi:hypothetical protein
MLNESITNNEFSVKIYRSRKAWSGMKLGLSRGIVVNNDALGGQCAYLGDLGAVNVYLNQPGATCQCVYRGNVLVVIHKDVVQILNLEKS